MQKVVLLEEAVEDIERAREFYEAQAPGVGDYFTSSLLIDLEQLARLAGSHSRQFGFHRARWPVVFRLRFITVR